MSDTSQGPGWWLASDGKWYAPELRPGQPMPQAPPPLQQASPLQLAASPPWGADRPMGPGWWQASDGRWYPPRVGGPFAQPAFTQPTKKRLYQRVWFWLLMAVAVVLGLGGCLSVFAGHRHMAAFVHSAHATSTITYSVTGTGPAKNITYATLQGGSRQNGEARVTDVTLPWSKTVTASERFLSFDVSATNGDGGGSLACSITENGEPLVSNTTKGAFATANCSYAG
jgi:hypothetical protein